MAHPQVQVGDIWFRVDGDWIDDGSETYQGMKLDWQQWRAVKVTPCGAWFECVQWPRRKHRFALSSGARWASRSKSGAIRGLIARKRRHIAILNQQLECAQETLQLALAALDKAQEGE